MSRYIRHGGFGTPGNRVNLVQSRSTSVFLANYREKPTGRNLTRSLKTTDSNEAKKAIGDIIERQKACRPAGGNETVLYVIQRGDSGPIKVGISRNLKRRISQLQNGNAEKLQVLRVYRMSDVERAIHAELEKQSRLEGEWFPDGLLSLVDRFFNVATEVVFQRSRKQSDARIAKAEHLARAGLL